METTSYDVAFHNEWHEISTFEWLFVITMISTKSKDNFSNSTY